MKRIHIIMNPKAGTVRSYLTPIQQLSLSSVTKILRPRKATKALLHEVKSYLKKQGYFVTHSYTRRKGHAIELARTAVHDGYDIVVAAGGDGTINEVINGVAKTRAQLGIIPVGTANSFAMELGIPYEILDAARLIHEGIVQKIDLGNTEGRYFMLCTGIGFDAKAIIAIRPTLKKRLGTFAYFIAAFETLLTYGFHKIHVHVDDDKRVREGYFVVIGNARYYGGKFEIAHKASITDGYLDVVIFKAKNMWHMLRTLPGIAHGKLTKHMDVEYVKAKKVRVTALVHQNVHVDAELLGETPIESRIVPKALKVIIPKICK